MPVRLIVIGPDGAGKSALLVRYLTKRFIESYQTGNDVVYRHQAQLQDSCIDVEILDASAYERRGFSGLSASADWADSFLAVYDVTMLDSGPRTRLFLDLARSARGPDRPLPIVLVGNKTDMSHRGHVDRADMEILSSQFHCRHFLVSAADDTKIIDLVFNGAVAEAQMASQWRRKSSWNGGRQQQQQQQQQQPPAVNPAAASGPQAPPTGIMQPRSQLQQQQLQASAPLQQLKPRTSSTGRRLQKQLVSGFGQLREEDDETAAPASGDARGSLSRRGPTGVDGTAT